MPTCALCISMSNRANSIPIFQDDVPVQRRHRGVKVCKASERKFEQRRPSALCKDAGNVPDEVWRKQWIIGVDLRQADPCLSLKR